MVYNGTTLKPSTTTVTPHPYPTTTDSTSDPGLNTRNTHRSTQTDDGSDPSGPQCTPSLLKKCEPSSGFLTSGDFSHPGCPMCPPDTGSGSGSGGSDNGSGDDSNDDGGDDDSTTSTSTPTPSSSIITPGMATEIAADPGVMTTEAIVDIDEVVTAISAQWVSMFGTALPTATATGLDSSETGTATTSSTSGSTTDVDCYTYSDPDNSLDDVYCQCPGYAGILPTLTGTASPCSYTTLPSATTTTTKAPTSDDPYPYTFTDLWGVVAACASEYTTQAAAYELSECAGSSTTLKEVTRTMTATRTTSVLSSLCMGGGYFECVNELEFSGVESCPKLLRYKRILATDYRRRKPVSTKGLAAGEYKAAEFIPAIIKSSDSSINSTYDDNERDFPLDQPLFMDMSHDDAIPSSPS
ncbi:hypothetical protein BDW59DRAFT_160353 [Aspergillus cavernicola]|uniref:Uncharacterized protein n=1 Tax=Aspergillus cavernicola TaxID=176166 RepID=A0ABR4II00_9EURO